MHEAVLSAADASDWGMNHHPRRDPSYWNVPSRPRRGTNEEPLPFKSKPGGTLIVRGRRGCLPQSSMGTSNHCCVNRWPTIPGPGVLRLGNNSDSQWFSLSSKICWLKWDQKTKEKKIWKTTFSKVPTISCAGRHTLPFQLKRCLKLSCQFPKMVPEQPAVQLWHCNALKSKHLLVDWDLKRRQKRKKTS